MPNPDPALDQSIKDLSAATSKNLEALMASGALQPGAGGWTPPPWLPWALGGLLGLLAGAGMVVAAPVVTPAVIIGAVSLASTTGIGTVVGLKSAGVRQLGG